MPHFMRTMPHFMRAIAELYAYHAMHAHCVAEERAGGERLRIRHTIARFCIWSKTLHLPGQSKTTLHRKPAQAKGLTVALVALQAHGECHDAGTGGAYSVKAQHGRKWRIEHRMPYTRARVDLARTQSC
jgi:hypothetical protein